MGNVCSSSNARGEEDVKAKSSRQKQGKAIARGPTFRYEKALFGFGFCIISCCVCANRNR